MSGKLDLTIEQGATFSRTITIKDASNVVVDISTDTAAMDAGDHVYDIEWTSGSTVTRLLEGTATVTPGVTR